MRRKDETLRESLLAAARETADREGLEAVNIRAIAGRAGVAPGTVYNYFSGKDEILLALTEEYWREALRELEAPRSGGDFREELREIFQFVGDRLRQSGGRLMGSLDRVEGAGLERMAAMRGRLEELLVQRLEGDPKIRGDLWSGDFSQRRLARFLVGEMMDLWTREEPDITFLLTVVEKLLY